MQGFLVEKGDERMKSARLMVRSHNAKEEYLW